MRWDTLNRIAIIIGIISAVFCIGYRFRLSFGAYNPYTEYLFTQLALPFIILLLGVVFFRFGVNDPNLGFFKLLRFGLVITFLSLTLTTIFDYSFLTMNQDKMIPEIIEKGKLIVQGLKNTDQDILKEGAIESSLKELDNTTVANVVFSFSNFWLKVFAGSFLSFILAILLRK